MDLNWRSGVSGGAFSFLAVLMEEKWRGGGSHPEGARFLAQSWPRSAGPERPGPRTRMTQAQFPPLQMEQVREFAELA